MFNLTIKLTVDPIITLAAIYNINIWILMVYKPIICDRIISCLSGRVLLSA